MAATTTVETDGHAAAPPAAQAPRSARSAEQTVTRGDRAGAGAATGGERSTGPDYTLLTPPSYDGIVGGVPPSPFASAMLLLGLICLIVAAVGSALGSPMVEWWTLGGMLVVIAFFLAAFVSRGA